MSLHRGCPVAGRPSSISVDERPGTSHSGEIRAAEAAQSAELSSFGSTMSGSPAWGLPVSTLPVTPSTDTGLDEAAGLAGRVSSVVPDDEQAVAAVVAHRTSAAEAATVRKRMSIPPHRNRSFPEGRRQPLRPQPELAEYPLCHTEPAEGSGCNAASLSTTARPGIVARWSAQ